MTHELKEILHGYRQASTLGIEAVLATVVALSGSSYRGAGVRMLVLENGAAFGAVSGGCVEKEIHLQAAAVFKSGVPRMMTYDGRYRLGCEGILHILLEPFRPEAGLARAFEEQLRHRSAFRMDSHYFLEDGPDPRMGSVLILEEGRFSVRGGFSPGPDTLLFEGHLPPLMRLLILGAEHDAVQLTAMASQLGWEVIVVVGADDARGTDHFKGALQVLSTMPETLDSALVDRQTAVILMTHSYSKDLKYLLRLSRATPAYLGILGPAHRRERLLGELLERDPEVVEAFLEGIHGPAGLDLAAESPQEIAISIIAEILSATRGSRPIPLREKQGAIHQR
ncbi:XdhC family protein [Robiginitalea marina]|uniref:XdhC family protein n=1 Tax=Robiginitalea marina TaxID=2954105 RepID=A0ABT1AV72_9FLAO|nr:XdhC/CoxI family protein [Robiginitalea marina]MCO5723525.1 XdhC family protein [Robiginitalea marina]